MIGSGTATTASALPTGHEPSLSMPKKTTMPLWKSDDGEPGLQVFRLEHHSTASTSSRESRLFLPIRKLQDFETDAGLL